MIYSLNGNHKSLLCMIFPLKHVLPSVKHTCTGSDHCLLAGRIPDKCMTLVCVIKAPVPKDAAAETPAGPAWDMYTSVFARRVKTSDSKDLFDNEEILKGKFFIEWNRMVESGRFFRAMGKYGIDEV